MVRKMIEKLQGISPGYNEHDAENRTKIYFQGAQFPHQLVSYTWYIQILATASSE